MGRDLSKAEIEFVVLGFTHGAISDYQMSAWLMAIVLQGMSDRETVDLATAMAQSGDILDLSSVGATVVHKHSTRGVGDNTTIVIAPLVACLGLHVGKMSGRGLGFSGGTLDKLEAIPGFGVNWTCEQFVDGKIRALRDVTATVASLPLIASSIMSKKIAAGASAVVLDVKTGSGAFMKTQEDAIA